jgi:hypothetical protein
MAVNGFQPVRLIATAQPYTLTYKYPGIEGLFKKAALSGWKQEKASESALTDYIRVSEKLAGEVEKQLDRLARSGDPVLVWGVGTNTQRLMASSPLAKANIIAFVDSNPHYHGKKVEGRPVLSPSEMGAYPHPVLIASFIFREEIKKQIREKLGLNNPLILLGAD